MEAFEKILQVSPEVRTALNESKPVVALESTIISHGMPYPQNVQTALQTQHIVRNAGAVPATVAILDGKLRVGLQDSEIDTLAKKGLAVHKASRRDLGVLVARGEDGATTVAATMILAHMAGVSVFATGGVGGVHRNAQATMDISADLDELSRTPTLVVCAGAKSILDLGLTLEYLETKGVPVVGYGTGELPAFYTRQSGYQADYRMDTPAQVAASWRAQRTLGLSGGMLLTCPIPEAYAMPADVIAKAIDEAVAEADLRGIKGKEITPFLLDKIKQITAGKSLEANIQLMYNNADIAARVAVELAQ